MPREAKQLEAALVKVAELTAGDRACCAVHAEDALNTSDNALGEAVEAWSERAAEMALANLRELVGPALRLAAALVHAAAAGPNVRTLLDVVNALDLKLPELDASSAAGQLAERVRAARASVDRALGHLGAGE